MHRAMVAALAAVLAASAAACGSGGGDGTPVLNLYYSPEENFQKVVDECNAEADGRYRIEYQTLPRGADDQRTQMVRRLAAGDSSLDILGLDVTWTAEFASAGWVLEWTGDNKAEAEAGTLAAPLESAQWEGRLYAAPKNTNAQLLWYRTDLMDEPPATWDEMIEMSQQLKESGEAYEIITMGSQYEGLVVLYNTLVESIGGQILNEEGTSAVFDEGAVEAMALLQRFASAGVTNPSFTNAQEDDARLQFQAGTAAFQLNYPFVYPAMQADAPELAENVRWARYPAAKPGQESPVTIGGFNLAVSAYSEHPEEAFDAVLCLRSPEHQKFSAINDGVPPTIESVYADPEMDEAYPMKNEILESVRDGVLRPQTPAYQNVSTVLSAVLHPPAEIQPQQTAEQLRRLVQDALESQGVLP